MHLQEIRHLEFAGTGVGGYPSALSIGKLSDEGIWLLYLCVGNDGILVSQDKVWDTHSAGADDGRCGRSGTCSPRGSFRLRGAPHGISSSSGDVVWKPVFPSLNKSSYVLSLRSLASGYGFRYHNLKFVLQLPFHTAPTE